MRSPGASGRAVLWATAGGMGLCALVLGGMAWTPSTGRVQPEDASWEMSSYEAVSRPSDVRELAFGIRGRIAELLVEAGTVVRRGEALIRMDDTVQTRTVALARLQAQNRTQLDAAAVTLAFRRNDLLKVREAFEAGAGTERELWDAEYRVTVAELEAASAQQSLEEAGLVLEREEARLAEMTILSPIDGAVVEVHKRGGEAVDEQTTVVTVIQRDPLWLDVNVRTRDALRLRPGQRAEVVWQDVEDAGVWGGVVRFISPAGHAGARQVMVRVEVGNALGLPSGLHATVRFLEPDDAVSGVGAVGAPPTEGSASEG